MFYLLVQGIASKRSFRRLPTVLIQVISDFNLLKKTTCCHSSLLMFIVSLVQRASPGVYFWKMLVKVITQLLCMNFAWWICLCHACTNQLLTSIIQRYAIMVWGVQDKNLHNAIIVIWMRWCLDWGENRKWRQMSKQQKRVWEHSEPGEATGRAWWGREGQGVGRAISFGIYLSSNT